MFKYLLIILVLFSQKSCAVIKVPQDLPKVFDVINGSCADNEDFCKIDIKLTPADEKNPSEKWRKIDQITKGDKRFYRRDVIYRGICVEKDGLLPDYNEYLNDGLRGSIERSYCIGKVKFYELVDFLDIILGVSFLCLTGRGKNKYIEIFSITNTWRDLRKPENSQASIKLRFIQGMRTITMVLVITCHNYSVMTLTFSKNPEYVENFSIQPVAQILIGSFGFVVQTFFAISAWLLALKLHSIVKKNGAITFKEILILAVNRYFRLIPAMILIIFLYRSIAMEVFLPPVYFSHLEAEQLRCRNGWWTNLLFIQNFSIFEGQMCSPPTWFIAVDTQLYIMTSLLFYLSYKFQLSMKLLLGITVIPALCMQTHLVMTTDFDGLYRVTPRNLPVELLSTSPEIIFSYINTICNVAPYAIGFVFGEIYSKNEQKTIFSTYACKIFWFISFLGLPLVTILLSLYEFPEKWKHCWLLL
ncbi:hypothetical protein WA026_013366 [Henosepilachna vigintioctopunctata]|uniref:Acyltransferase 3 domain-containing protein n=1 Tax=Henosepilachna vigintioctopunctata TaxID=420089 RepID=A0AAW1VD82_9CUCU